MDRPLGPVDFALFSNFMQGMLFAVPLGTVQYGDLQKIFHFGSKTKERYPFKGPYFQTNPGTTILNFFMHSLISVLYLKHFKFYYTVIY